jgi:acetyl esterase/lipase
MRPFAFHTIDSTRFFKNLISMCVIFSMLSFSITGCSDDEEKFDRQEEVVQKNLSYGESSSHLLDLHLPADRSSRTRMVVFIHGGGWREGSKEQFDFIRGQFVAAGLATASINYRYADAEQNISYVNLLEDIDLALKYLSDHASEYGYNGSDVVLFGHSAGAHLALLYAYRNNDRNQVKSVISLSAPTDLQKLLEIGTFPSLLYNLVGSEEPSKFADASPIEHVGPGVVRTYIMHGKSDESVPYKQSQELYNMIHQFSSSAKLKLYDDVGHDYSEETYPLIVRESIEFALH